MWGGNFPCTRKWFSRYYSKNDQMLKVFFFQIKVRLLSFQQVESDAPKTENSEIIAPNDRVRNTIQPTLLEIEPLKEFFQDLSNWP